MLHDRQSRRASRDKSPQAWTLAREPAVVRALALALIGLVAVLAGSGCLASSEPFGDGVGAVSGASNEPATSEIARPGQLKTPSPMSSLTPFPVPATVTLLPTSTSTSTPVPTDTPSPTPTPTPVGPCAQRLPGDDLLALITLEYGISRNYEPEDLVQLSDHIPESVTQGYPMQVRRIIVEPLKSMIADMQTAGLQPLILSSYRSYAAQTIARTKWLNLEPDRVGIISAPPGHSEHQLGTTVDFGSPELAEIVDQEDVEFHTYFYKTGEGQWLLENAHAYGFTLSYTRESFEVTGLYYEPWHYRYVGAEMAGKLKARNLTLSEYLLSSQPPPCIP